NASIAITTTSSFWSSTTRRKGRPSPRPGRANAPDRKWAKAACVGDLGPSERRPSTDSRRSASADDRDLATDHVYRPALALSLDQHEVAAARDDFALAVSSVPGPVVESGIPSRRSPIEDHAAHQGAAVGVDAEGHGRQVVQLVRDRGGLGPGVERVRIVRDVAAGGGGIHVR